MYLQKTKSFHPHFIHRLIHIMHRPTGDDFQQKKEKESTHKGLFFLWIRDKCERVKKVFCESIQDKHHLDNQMVFFMVTNLL